MSASNRDPQLLEADIDEVDRLPRPSRRALSLDAIVATCRLAVARARADNVERRAQTFRDIVRGMEPATPTTMSIDGWARLGAVQGALDRWGEVADAAGRSRGAPSEDHRAAFISGYGLGWQITHHALTGVRGG